MNPFALLPPELAWVITTHLDWRALNGVLKVDRRLRLAGLKEARMRKLELEENLDSRRIILGCLAVSSSFGTFCDRYGPLGEEVVILAPKFFNNLDLVQSAHARGGYLFRSHQGSICRKAIEERRFSLLESDAIDRTVRIRPRVWWALYETDSPLFHAVVDYEYAASEYRRLLKAGYRLADTRLTLAFVVVMLWKGWSTNLNMPKDVFGLEEVDREELSQECRRICRAVPSRRIHILKGLATLGADVDVMEGVASEYMMLEERKILRLVLLDRARWGSERKRKRDVSE